MGYTIRDVRTNEKLVDTEYSRQSSALRSFNSRHYTPQVAYIANEDWREREQQRTNLINLEQFGLIAIVDHFLHVSAKSTYAEFLVSYTENPIKGSKDVQSSGRKIGRYLTEFYADLGSERINQLSHEISATINKIPVEFIRASKDFRRVYEKSHKTYGMNSCMTYGAPHFNLVVDGDYVHPVEAYGDGELALAVIYRDKEISARCLVWETRKVYGRIYGPDSEKLKTLLHQAGFHNGSMEGAPLKTIKIPSTNPCEIKMVVPYIDNDRYVHVDKEGVLRIGSNTKGYKESSTGGWVSFLNAVDAVTGEKIPERNLMSVYHPDTRTVVYVDERHYQSRTIEAGGYHYAKINYPTDGQPNEFWGKNPRRNQDGFLPSHFLRRNFYQSVVSGNWVHPDDSMSTNEGYVTLAEFFQLFARCQVTGSIYRQSNMTMMENGQFWSNEALSMHATRQPDGTYMSNYPLVAEPPTEILAA